MNYSIIIPNYNGQDFLKSSLTSLLTSINNCPNSKFQIILVDNNSSDKSLNIFNDFLKNNKNLNISSKILKQDSNKGFAKAVNIGIKESTYDWVLILNNDLTLDKNWINLIDKNINQNKDKNIATFCGTVLNKNGSQFESQGLDFYFSAKCININNKQKFDISKLENDSNKLVWGSSAAIVVYNKSVLNKVNLFDEDFFAYEEDVDLSLRLNKLGYKTIYIPEAISYHLGGGTSNKMSGFRAYHDTKNWYYIIIKNFTIKQIFSNLPSIFIERLKNIKYLINSTKFPKKIFIIFILYTEILINFPKMLKKRKELQKLVKYTS